MIRRNLTATSLPIKGSKRKVMLAAGLCFLWFCQITVPCLLAFSPASSTPAIPLLPEKPHTGELTDSQPHSYQLAVAAGQYLRVEAVQLQGNVALALLNSRGEEVATADVSYSSREEICVLVENPSEFRLLIRTADAQQTPARYQVQIADLRVPTEADRLRVAAAQAFATGEQLRQQKTSASSQAAASHYEAALNLYRQAGDKRGEAYTLFVFGKLLIAANDRPRAVTLYQQALPLMQQLGEHSAENNLWYSLGTLSNSLGQIQQALTYLNESLTRARARDDRQCEAQTLYSLGVVQAARGTREQATESLQQARNIWQVLGNRDAEAKAITMLGSNYEALGEKQKAVDCLLQALPLLRQTGNQHTEAHTLYLLGLTYDSLGERATAMDYYRQALPLRQAIGHLSGEAARLRALGGIYYGLREKQQALDHYQRALALYEQQKDLKNTAQMLRNIGQAYDIFGEKQKALEYFNRALPLFRLGADPQTRARLLSDLGRVLEETGAPEQALTYLNEALPVLRKLGHRFFELQTLYYLARAESACGRLREAHQLIKETLALVETLRSEFHQPELCAAGFARAQDFYDLAIDVLMRRQQQEPQQHYAAEALHLAELARARMLLDTLAEARADIRHGVASELLLAERRLQEQIGSQSARLLRLLSGKHTTEQETDARRDLAQAQAEYAQVQSQIRRTSPQYAALMQPRPLTLADIQQQILDDDTLLLEYRLGPQRSYLWAISRDSYAVYQLPGRDQIEQAARQAYELLNARNQRVKFETADEKLVRVVKADADYWPQAAALSRIILAPAADQLTKKRLLIVSDGALQYLPFAALPDPVAGGQLLVTSEEGHRPSASSPQSLAPAHQPLIVSHEIITLPSASTLAVLRAGIQGRTPAPKSVAVLADPVFTTTDPRLLTALRISADAMPGKNPLRDSETSVLVRAIRESGWSETGLELPRLPFTRQEAKAITALVPAAERREALDFAASRATITGNELAQYRYVHIATHGLISTAHPELSGLVFSLVDEQGRQQNGFLRMHDLFNLNLPAELVVLSACRTGLGQELKGEGIISLTRGFMYAGAARVMVSLWDVNDQATAELMTKLYQSMLGPQRLSPAAALRAAQLAMLHDQRWQSPWYWAAFTLQGEPQ